MGFLGILLYLAALVFAGMLGYEANFKPEILILLPFVVMIGYILRRGAKSSKIFMRPGLGIIIEIVGLYVNCLIIVVAAFGIGWGVMEILEHKPPPGAGGGW